MELTSLYAAKPSEYFDSARVEIYDVLPSRLGRVLEVGCGTGSTLAWLKGMSDLATSETWGIEIHGPSAEVARNRVDRVIHGPIEEVLPTVGDERFDTILCLDVIEHLVDPWRVVKALFGLCRPGGCMILSVPNLRYWQVLYDLVVRRQFRYEEKGILDQSHLRFFTAESVCELLAGAGGREVTLQFHPRTLGGLTAVLNAATFNVARDVFSWQLLVRAFA